ncbi:MAG: DUF423 domain-containing protein [Brevundimonas sp.]|jgi:uncharacterized membrane protein YgdD (TMEM256/DUF423 family)|nr:DUF423 domain-containing protein [Brevundimonas sp.]
MTHALRLAVFAALSGALSVALGAFAAHGVEPKAEALLRTGAQYQGVHAVLGFICALAAPPGLMRLGGWLAASGGLLFSLALAGIALLDIGVMGAVAPLGSSLMILGWLGLAAGALRPLPSHPASPASST